MNNIIKYRLYYIVTVRRGRPPCSFNKTWCCVDGHTSTAKCSCDQTWKNEGKPCQLQSIIEECGREVPKHKGVFDVGIATSRSVDWTSGSGEEKQYFGGPNILWSTPRRLGAFTFGALLKHHHWQSHIKPEEDLKTIYESQICRQHRKSLF